MDEPTAGSVDRIDEPPAASVHGIGCLVQDVVVMSDGGDVDAQINVMLRFLSVPSMVIRSQKMVHPKHSS